MHKIAAVSFALVVLCGSAANAAGLSDAELVNRGFPAADRVWAGTDFARANDALNSLTPDQFPRHGSPTFQRMTEKAALQSCSNANMAASLRIPDCLSILKGSLEIVKTYGNAVAAHPALLDDVIYLSAFLIRAEASTGAALEEFMPTLDKNDPSYPTRMKGFEQARQGYVDSLNGALQELESREGNAARADLAQAIAEAYPLIRTYLPDMTDAEYKMRLRKLAQHDPDPDVRAALAQYAQ